VIRPDLEGAFDARGPHAVGRALEGPSVRGNDVNSELVGHLLGGGFESWGLSVARTLNAERSTQLLLVEHLLAFLDHLPERAFLLKGTIDEVIEEGEKMVDEE
jgi:hypothetical protein